MPGSCPTPPMPTHPRTKMVTVCQKCGDRGYEDLLIYCAKCQDYALHRYCLDDVPAETFYHEDHTWFCEDCEPKIVRPSILDKPEEVQTTHPRITSKKNRYNKKLKMKRRLKKKSNRKDFKRSVAKTKVQLCEGNPSEHEAEGSENCYSGQKLVNQCRQIVKDPDIAESVKTSQIATSNPLEICYVPAQPIIDPIWRGSLSIFNKDFSIVSGIVAHLSSLACLKVREEAELLPLLLFPELIGRIDVWPKGFQKCGPSDQSIALFFFPDNERDEKDFDSLVASMIKDDQAMRAVLENAELLVFTSVILPEQYRRFQNKIYLWGVFRAKQFPQLTNDNASGGEKGLAKPLTCYRQSPVSPFSNDVGSGTESFNSLCTH